MNARLLDWALSAEGVPAQCVAVLVGLARHAGRDGKGAGPSVETLAGYSRKGTRQVKKDLHMLVEKDIIRVSDDQSAVAYLRADRRPTVYDLILDGVNHRPPREVKAADRQTPERGEPQATPLELRGEPEDTPSGARGEPQATSQNGHSTHGVNHSSPEEEPTVVTSRTKVTSQTGRQRSPRGERLPAGWLPSRDLVDWARKDCPDVDSRKEHENFVDHWRSTPGVKGTKLDWPATWRKWMREEQKRLDAQKRRRGNAPAQRKVSEGFHDGVTLAERIKAEENAAAIVEEHLMIEESA